MRQTRQLSVTLPIPMADKVRARVESGQYASESEVLREGLRALEAQEEAVERWLRGPVLEAVDEWKQGNATLLTVEEVRAELARDA